MKKKILNYRIVRTKNVSGENKWKIVWNEGFSPDDKFDTVDEARRVALDYIKTYGERGELPEGI